MPSANTHTRPAQLRLGGPSARSCSAASASSSLARQHLPCLGPSRDEGLVLALDQSYGFDGPRFLPNAAQRRERTARGAALRAHAILYGDVVHAVGDIDP